MARPRRLRADQARRAVLAAQGLGRPRPTGRVDRRHLRRVVDALGMVQIDSVNVLERAHHVPFFSRLGPHDRSILHTMAYEHLELFEYWGHVASLIDVELEPLLRWRMARTHQWTSPEGFATRRPDLVAAVERAVHDDGPLTASEIAEHLGEVRSPAGAWWGWDDTKKAVEYLFWGGRVAAIRSATFERRYCHPTRAVPSAILDRPTPPEAEAHAELVVRAARGHGVATVKDLADYWRMRAGEVLAVLPDLVGDGRLLEVDVDGWGEPAYLHPDVTIPRSVDAAALVSPFDVAMWERDRIERIHGFTYRIEIYVPAPRRVYGYYVLPFLLGDTFVARVDLKADRAGRRLLVQSAHVEADLGARGVHVGEVAERLDAELAEMARWLDLDDVVVVGPGDLAPALSGGRRAGG